MPKKKKGRGLLGRGKGGGTTTDDGAQPITAQPKVPFAKKVVMLIWRPKYTRGNVGHAALKMKSTDENGDLKRIDYMSWWPRGTPKGAEGMLTPRTGGKQTYWEDQIEELDFGVRAAIFMSYVYRAYQDDDRDPMGRMRPATRKVILDDILKNAWRRYPADHDVKKRWIKMGFTENFGNMGELVGEGKIGMRPGKHRMKKGTQFAQDDGSFNLSEMEAEGTTWMGKTQATWLQSHVRDIGRYPDAKVYIPCAHLKPMGDRAGHIPVWGLSLDMVRLSWVIFRETRDPKWQMLTNQLNCASVVWNRMLEGFMDAFVKPKGSAWTLGTTIIDPNDAEAISKKLDKALTTVNNQQERLFKLADDNFGAVSGLMTSNGLDDPGNWRKLLQLDLFKALSARKSHRRPQSLRAVDGLVGRYEKVKKRIRREEEIRVVEALLVDEMKFKDLKRAFARAKGKVRDLEGQSTTTAKKLALAKKKRDIRDSQEETTRAYMIANFDYLKKPRIEMARHLVKLLDAVDKCTKALKAGHPRLPAVILLGLAAGWAFYELATLGHYIDYVAPRDDHSFYCVTAKQMIHYSGPVVKPEQREQQDRADNVNVILSNLELS